MAIFTRPEKKGLMATTSSIELTSAHNADTTKPTTTLDQSSPSWFMRVGLTIPVIVIPVAYIVLVVLMGCINGKPQNSFGDNVAEVATVASTLWPISFAAVIGPLLKTLALLCAEKGSTLVSLEFLLTSQTTASAVKNVFTMGFFRSWAVAIVAIWFLSPLGGQAALRCLYLKENIIQTEVPALYYLGNNSTKMYIYYFGGAYAFQGASAAASELSNLRAVVSTSFFAPSTLVSHANGSSSNFANAVKGLGGKLQASQSGQRDLWRNVKVPFVQYLPGYDHENPTSWVSVPQDQVVSYASHVGLPVRGASFDRAGNSTMFVKYHYQTLSCGDAFEGTDLVRNGSTALRFHNTSSDTALRHQYLGTNIQNTGYPNVWFDILNTSAAAREATFYNPPQGPWDPRPRLQLVMGEPCWSSLKFESWNRTRVCNIGISYVEMEVQCTRATAVADLVCQATRARHAPSYPINGNLTALSNTMLARNVLNQLAFTGATLRSSQFSMLERYLRDPPTSLQPSFERAGGAHNGPNCDFSPPTDILERRLATALNTMIMASYKTADLTGGDEISVDDSDSIWEKTNANWTEYGAKTYALNVPWYCTTVISVVILLICAVANVVVRQLIKAPDFLDSVVGLTRDSPFINLSQDGSGLSGADRLNTIRDVKVRICDVYPEQEVGRVALTTDLGGPELRWERAYT
ncbi:hypothetical protein FHETE_7022 [Fusarium heterosporum]|uniref:Uncharacterized protein n=1 Tax=Fusarium heterosporum TaxID=42747 RepID=A0A8H5T7J4_FUSHE|nr:hypothetical protein FHETE_7022 [Fusarium heterosporum]